MEGVAEDRSKRDETCGIWGIHESFVVSTTGVEEYWDVYKESAVSLEKVGEGWDFELDVELKKTEQHFLQKDQNELP